MARSSSTSVFSIALLVVFGQVASAAGRWDNIVPNPGFEEVTDNGWLSGEWRQPSPLWRVDDTVSHSGKRSLTVSNANPKGYTFPSVVIPAELGESYDLSAWVKTKDVKDAGQEQAGALGATTCLQWQDKDGKWLGGFYNVQGLLGTQDWQKISAENIAIPAEAHNITFTVYLRKGLTGQTWFDDVSLTRHRKTLLSTFLSRPNYRGIFFAPGEGQVALTLNLEDHDLTPQSALVKAELKASAAERPAWSREIIPQDGTTPFTFSSKDVPEGVSDFRGNLFF